MEEIHRASYGEMVQFPCLLWSAALSLNRRVFTNQEALQTPSSLFVQREVRHYVLSDGNTHLTFMEGTSPKLCLNLLINLLIYRKHRRQKNILNDLGEGHWQTLDCGNLYRINDPVYQ